MRYVVHRLSDDSAVVTIELARSEADEVCKELVTGDESPPASKLVFGAFRDAADGRLSVRYASTNEEITRRHPNRHPIVTLDSEEK
jgi:hypothetical protein